MDAHPATLECAVPHQVAVQGGVGANAFHYQFVQGLAHPGQGHLPVLPEADDLAYQRIVKGRHRIAVIEVGIHPDAGPARGVERGDLAGGGQEGLGVLGVDPAFKGVAEEPDIALLEGQGQAGGNAQLFLDDVDAGDHVR